MAAWASYEDCFCTASLSGYLVNKPVQNTYGLYVLKSRALQGTVPFSVEQHARWSNLSLILEGLCQHVLDHRLPGDMKQSSAYIADSDSILWRTCLTKAFVYLVFPALYQHSGIM